MTLTRLTSRTRALLVAGGWTVLWLALLDPFGNLIARLLLASFDWRSMIGFAVVALLALALTQTAMLRVLLAGSRGEPCSLRASLGFAMTRLGPALWLAFPVALAVLAGSWLFSLAWLLLAQVLFFWLGPSVLFESGPAGQAAARAVRQGLARWPLLLGWTITWTTASLVLGYGFLLLLNLVGLSSPPANFVLICLVLPLTLASIFSLWAGASLAWYEAMGPGELAEDLRPG